jgi:methyl-accepting chemotaxis protein
MAENGMSIRFKLLAMGAVLACIILAFGFALSLEAWRGVATSRAAALANTVADDLVRASRDLAIERGTMNIILANPAAATEQQRQMATERSAAATKAIAEALALLASSKNEALLRAEADVRAAMAALEPLRTANAAIISQAAPATKEQRAAWFAGVTAAIDRIIALNGLTALEQAKDIDGRIQAAVRLRSGYALMAEFAGRERGEIAGLLAAGTPMTASQIFSTSRNHGMASGEWGNLKFAYVLDADFTAINADIERLYFKNLAPLRQAILDAAANGQPAAIKAADWFAQSTTAIEAMSAASARMSGQLEALLAQSSRRASLILAFGVACLVFAGLVIGWAAWLVLRQVTQPLTNMTQAMGALATGDWSADIPALERGDEIGAMAKAVAIFKRNGLENVALRAEQARERERAEQARRDSLEAMAATVETEMRSAVSHLISRTDAMNGNAEAMAQSASHVSENSQTVASAASQALANAEAVAAATEELTSSIHEISKQISQATRVSAEAVSRSAETEGVIRSLSEVVSEISAVTELIREIADQTNLLALNATIEAARAGDAGKGFAVVAGEVKNLASQTAKATEDISQKIAKVKGVTEASVGAVRSIGFSIRDMDEIAAAIAAAMEEQAAATQEIARNVSQTAHAAREVAARIERVSAEAAATGYHAGDVRGAAADVASSITDLRGTLVRVVRTATTEVDRRHEERAPVDADAMLDLGQGACAVHLRNLSQGGAMLERQVQGVVDGAIGRLRIEVTGAAATTVPCAMIVHDDGSMGVRFLTEGAEHAGLRESLTLIITTLARNSRKAA